MYYVVDVSGWEEYEPHWFQCDCNKEEFDEIVRESLDKAVDDFLKKEPDDSICGHNLMVYLLPILEKHGFVEIKIDHEISIGGGCLYRDKADDRAEVFSDLAWAKVIEHNNRLHEEMHKEFRREDAEREAKKSKFQKILEKIVKFVDAIRYKNL